MSPSEIGSPLAYHSDVRSDGVVAGVNRPASDDAAGLQVFCPIYSDGEIAADPTERDTGLFFFRAEQGAPFRHQRAGRRVCLSRLGARGRERTFLL
jgi:hypothetical protein